MQLRPLLVNKWSIRAYFCGIAMISIFGAYYLSTQIRILNKDIPGIVTAKRNAAAESVRLFSGLRDAIVDPRFSRYPDYLWADSQQFTDERIRKAVGAIARSARELEELRQKLPSSLTEQTMKLLRNVAAAGARALNEQGETRKDRAIDFLEIVEAAYPQLVAYIQEKSTLQLETAAEQKQRLRETTIAAAALLAVFALFAVSTGLLLQAELAAQQKRREAEEKARFLAYHDPLTLLANRTLFSETANSLKSGEPRMLILADLDEFKNVNDMYGHTVGDALLVEVARRIGKFVTKRKGIAARLGGDEFAAVIPGVSNSKEAVALCADLLAAIARPFYAEGLSLTQRASIGAVVADGEAPGTLSELLTRADLALHEAKSHGQDRFVIYHEELAEKARYRREIKDAVPHGLKNEEFEVHFQPQINLQSGRLSGFEALVRWRRNGKLMAPDEFIPILEETGLIRLMDLWVLRRAARTAAGWLEIRRRPLTVSVNLSPLHFQFDDIVTHVRRTLQETGLPPNLLTLEITESVLLDNWDRVVKIMTSLSQLGVNLSLDDFGTGYSSLAYLRNLKVNELKIDRAFVTDLESSAETRIVLNSVVEIARGLGMSIVVEGIETLGQRDIVNSIGAHTGQGFLFGRPVPENQVMEIVNSDAFEPDDRNGKAEAGDRNVSARIA